MNIILYKDIWCSGIISEYLTILEQLVLETSGPLEFPWDWPTSFKLDESDVFFLVMASRPYTETSGYYIKSLLCFYYSLCSTLDRLLQLNFIPLGLYQIVHFSIFLGVGEFDRVTSKSL